MASTGPASAMIAERRSPSRSSMRCVPSDENQPRVKVLGRNPNIAAFLRRPVEVLVHGLLSQSADNRGRDKHHQRQENKYANNTFLHVDSL